MDMLPVELIDALHAHQVVGGALLVGDAHKCDGLVVVGGAGQPQQLVALGWLVVHCYRQLI